jgi:hypothetical protein
MQQFVDQVFAHRVHRRKEAQPQVLGCHVTKKIVIEDCILRHQPADQNRRSVAQEDVPLAQCDISVGTVIVARMPRVTPPSTNSRKRECP